MRIVVGSDTASATPPPQRLAVTRDEWDLVWALREVPAGALKARLQQLLLDIVAFVNAPGCAEAQADGVPCATTSRDCVECRRVDSCLALLHETLHFR